MTCDQLLTTVGKRIRAARKRLGLSQETLAERAGIHPTYISDLENAKANASLCVFDAVARALGLTLAELVTVEQDVDDLVGLLAEARNLDEDERRIFLIGARGVLLGIRER